ncbi:hypothetical protein MG5_03203 [Candida albicans P57072]|nr:hypothetical protein MG5_03203 [Candida albicans P57072]
MPFVQSLRNLTSSTESKIKSATNNEPLGPYNHELTELASLTFSKKHLSIIISIITKRLKPVLDICPTTMNSTGMKRSNTSKLSSTIHRTHSFPRRSKTLPSPDTPSDVNTLKYKQVLDDKVYLSLLKALTVILYLLQNGSVQFIDWLLKDYKSIISPLSRISYPSTYKEPIRHKVNKIISLLEAPEDLNNYRINIHKLRTDMLVPGLKRTSLDGVDLLQVEQEHSTREQQQQQAPRRPATPPLLRLRSISEHYSHTEDEYINSNDVYNSSKTAADFSFTNNMDGILKQPSRYQPITTGSSPPNTSPTITNPHQLPPIF